MHKELLNALKFEVQALHTKDSVVFVVETLQFSVSKPQIGVLKAKQKETFSLSFCSSNLTNQALVFLGNYFGLQNLERIIFEIIFSTKPVCLLFLMHK